jgi:hypothetical protein
VIILASNFCLIPVFPRKNAGVQVGGEACGGFSELKEFYKEPLSEK